jgi:hypothetical protein
MNVQHLHDIRDGKPIRRRRAYNPYIHLSPHTPLMQMLYNITRPVTPENAVLKPLVRAAKKKIVKAAQAAGGSMVSYAKERKQL